MSEKQKVIEKLKDDPLMPLRHTCEHVLHMAVQELYPDTKKVMGPPIKDGFYFDFDLEESISPEDFPKIEKKMKEIISANLKVAMREVTLEEAKEIFKDNEYKLATLDEITNREEKITLYTIGSEGNEYFDLDLCAGPHVQSTGEIKAFKLLSVAGAYYKGDENNKMLQRIYGTAFDTKEGLENYLEMLEEAKERDHRKLGKELELFTFDTEEVGPGLPLWLPNGAIIVEELEKFAKENEEKQGYSRVKSPHIAKEALFLKSGHLPYYEEDMFPAMELDNEKYYLKAMNCPHHHKIYEFRPRSYRELPLRLAEYGHCYRYEDSGSLFGLMRVRSLNMNDAHIYCTEDQFEDEFKKVIELYVEYFKAFGVEKYEMRLSKHSKEGLGKKYVDEPELWEKTEEQVRNALIASGVDFVEAEDEAAFYGPKIDVQIWSAIGREFTIATNQLDFAQPRRFNLTYMDSDGQEKTPIVIHRAPLGTHERTIGFLIEHFGGAFPVWMSPNQVTIIPIGEKHVEYANEVAQKFREKGLRVEVNDRDDKMGAKIRQAQLQKIPYMLVIGDKEVNDKNVSVRLRTNEDLGAMKVDKLVDRIVKIRDERSLEL